MSINNEPTKKRRIILIDKAFQGRFIVSVLATIVIFGLCSAGLIYWLISGDLEAQSQAAHINIANTWERLGLSILIGNIVAAVIAGLMAIIVVLYISHKIAGPLYRFESLCKDVGDGKLDTMTHLRTNDQLQALAQSFTLMVEKLRVKQENKSNLLVEVNQQLNHFKNDSNLAETQQSAVENIELLLIKIKEL